MTRDKLIDVVRDAIIAASEADPDSDWVYNRGPAGTKFADDGILTFSGDIDLGVVADKLREALTDDVVTKWALMYLDDMNRRADV